MVCLLLERIEEQYNDVILLRIEINQLVRILLQLFIIRMRQRKWDIRRVNSKYIFSFCDKHKEKRCFAVGNGLNLIVIVHRRLVGR